MHSITNISINKSNFFSKQFTLLVILYPLLSVYGIKQVNLGMACMFFLIFIYFFTKKQIKMKWPKYFWTFFVYMLLTRFFHATDCSTSSLFSLSLISFSILLGFSCNFFNLQYGIRIYKIVVLICCVFFSIQEIMYFLTGSRIVGLLPFLPLNIAIETTTRDYINIQSSVNRSASFFLEPAQFSQYVIPLLAMELFKNKKEKGINFYVILITVVILLLRSGTGILVMSLIYSIWLYFSIMHSNYFKKFLVILIYIPAIVLGSYFFNKSEIGKELTERKSEFSGVNSTTSAYVRIIRGFDLFADFPVFNKWFGMNSPTKIKSFISNSKMYYLFEENDLLFSCIQSILIYGGFIGMLIFSIHFLCLLRNNYIEGQITAVTFMGLSIISPIYLMGEMLLCYTIVYSFQQIYLKNKLL